MRTTRNEIPIIMEQNTAGPTNPTIGEEQLGSPSSQPHPQPAQTTTSLRRSERQRRKPQTFSEEFGY